MANDLALVRLARPSNAPTVALARTAPILASDVTLAGWGLTNDTGARPDNMQQGQFMVWLPIGAKMML